jgi:WD40 repeat protein
VDRTTGRTTAEADFAGDTVAPGAFSPGGRWLLVDGPDATLVCDPSDPKLPIVGVFQVTRTRNHPRLASGSSPLGQLSGNGLFAFSTDDRFAVVARNGTGKVVVTEITSGRTVVTVETAHKFVLSVDFSRDGKRFVTRSWKSMNFAERGMRQFWDVGTGQEMFLGGEPSDGQGIAWLSTERVPDDLARERLRIGR